MNLLAHGRCNCKLILLITHYLNQCWPSFMMPYCINKPQWFNNTIKKANHEHIACKSSWSMKYIWCRVSIWWLGNILNLMVMMMMMMTIIIVVIMIIITIMIRIIIVYIIIGINFLLIFLVINFVYIHIIVYMFFSLSKGHFHTEYFELPYSIDLVLALLNGQSIMGI